MPLGVPVPFLGTQGTNGLNKRRLTIHSIPTGRDCQVVPVKHGPLRFQMMLKCHRTLTGVPPFVVAMEEGRLRNRF